MRVKCAECGLSNFASATHCKRCHSPLDSSSTSQNMWREGKFLVVSLQGFTLPNRCLKCNTDVSLSKEVLEINYYPSINYLTILPGLHTVFWTRYTIPAFLCGTHRIMARTGPTNTMLPNLLIIFGVLSLIVGFAAEWNGILLGLGIGLLGFGLLLNKWAKPAFKIKRRAKPLVWISGVHPQYLDLLPVHK